MADTALRARLLSASGTCPATAVAELRPQGITSHKESVTYGITHMVFANVGQEKIYFENWAGRVSGLLPQGIDFHSRFFRGYRNHPSQIYSIKSGCIKPECLYQGCGPVERAGKSEQGHPISHIFCCGYAMYLTIEGILAEMEGKCAENPTDGDKE